MEKLERYTPLKLSEIKSESILDLYYQIEKDSFNLLINMIMDDVKLISLYIKGESLTPRLE